MIEEKDWVRCPNPNCRHKLFYRKGKTIFIPTWADGADMSIKCHSCHKVYYFRVAKEK